MTSIAHHLTAKPDSNYTNPMANAAPCVSTNVIPMRYARMVSDAAWMVYAQRIVNNALLVQMD